MPCSKEDGNEFGLEGSGVGREGKGPGVLFVGPLVQDVPSSGASTCIGSVCVDIELTGSTVFSRAREAVRNHSVSSMGVNGTKVVGNGGYIRLAE